MAYSPCRGLGVCIGLSALRNRSLHEIKRDLAGSSTAIMILRFDIVMYSSCSRISKSGICMNAESRRPIDGLNIVHRCEVDSLQHDK